MRTLVLDQGYQPQQIVSWQRAVSLLYVGKADLVEEYEHVIRSVSLAMNMPSVVRMRKRHKRPKQHVKFSRLNVFLRDGFRCQYCGERGAMSDLTYDHVFPRSRGGATSWENIVTACRDCNFSKANRTPEEAGMKLRKVPVRPKRLPHGTVHVHVDRTPETWRSWIPKHAQVRPACA